MKMNRKSERPSHFAGVRGLLCVVSMGWLVPSENQGGCVP